ncbi:hypothetical protein ACFPM3_04885 [Streptomyces coeruleoprunus]|uniref:Sulfite exporter TauE/SafE family protein n=1 Tax=Streptomyces coeruleoprunus TaxID=285563 RepID=A0ABV9X9U5_9ACTN
MEPKRSWGRALLISMLVLFLEAALALVVAVVYGFTQESPNAGGTYALALPLLAVVGAFAGAAVSLALVLPAVWLSEALGRRFGGREAWWWVPPAAATAALVPVVAGVVLSDAADWGVAVKSWLVVTASLTAPIWFSRLRRRGLFGSLALWGTLVVACAGTLGGIALHTGLLEEYRPPTITPAALVGTWSDGRGGTLTVAPDGRVTAFGVDDHGMDANVDIVVNECTGEGTWTFDAGENPWTQRVDLTVHDCQWPAWNVGGTAERITLYQYIGDPDAGHLYELTKTRGGS